MDGILVHKDSKRTGMRKAGAIRKKVAGRSRKNEGARSG